MLYQVFVALLSSIVLEYNVDFPEEIIGYVLAHTFRT